MQNVLKRSLVFITVFALFVAMSIVLPNSQSYAATPKPKKITLKAQAKTVDIGATLKVSVKSVTPKKASKKVKWSIKKGKKYAKLTKKKSTSVYVKGTKKGTVTLKATSKAKKKVTKSVTIKVKNLKAKKVKLNKTKATVIKGKTLQLKATVTAPQKYGYKKQKTSWKSSNTKVATVSKAGKVTAKSAGTVTITASNDGKKATCKVTIPKAEILKPYVMVGYYNKAKLNYVDVDSYADVKVWDAATKKTKTGKNTKATILGNYVQMTDRDANGKADLLEVVKYKDGVKKWDATMTWKNGQKAFPGTDAEGKDMFSEEQRIPNGERLLTGFGLAYGSGTTDFHNLAKSTYWTDNDYYNAASSSTLTILSGYKTQLQTTGWTCVLSSALSTLEWYGQRGDLNEEDLAALRSDTRSRWAGGTSLKELENVYKKLGDLKLTCEWTIEDSFDKDGIKKIYKPEYIKDHLKKGHPIVTIWNSYGGHGQVIIGYDDMGTTVTSDDVLILMDPYDSTDHDADGYNLQSYERWAYGLSGDKNDGIQEVRYLVAYPKNAADWKYTAKTGDGFSKVEANRLKNNGKDAENKLSKSGADILEQTRTDLKSYYQGVEDEWIAYNKKAEVGGPLGIDVSEEGKGDYDKSPYYNFFDFYNVTGLPNTLKIIKNFKTIQQSTEWTCGCTSATMVMNHFNKGKVADKKGKERIITDLYLSNLRQEGEEGATYLSGMKQIFDTMNSKYEGDWVYVGSDSLREDKDGYNYIGSHPLEGGASEDGLIPYLIKKGIPMMIGWDEWGGHWQTIIGYDDMGTEETQDDVLVLADSYDTTDHDQDGYVLESFERLVYGWNVQFEMDETWGTGESYYDFLIAFPLEDHEGVARGLGATSGQSK